MLNKEEFKYRLQYALDINGKKAADLCRDLKIPKSAMSQYLSGKSQNMTADRLNMISKYLNVSEAWLMGYDVSMDRNDGISADGKGDDPKTDELQTLLGSLSREEIEELIDYIRYLLSKREK